MGITAVGLGEGSVPSSKRHVPYWPVLRESGAVDRLWQEARHAPQMSPLQVLQTGSSRRCKLGCMTGCRRQRACSGARTDDDHVDAVDEQLAPQALREALQALLGRHVGRQERRRQLARRRGNHDDAPGAAAQGQLGAQQRQEGLRRSAAPPTALKVLGLMGSVRQARAGKHARPAINRRAGLAGLHELCAACEDRRRLCNIYAGQAETKIKQVWPGACGSQAGASASNPSLRKLCLACVTMTTPIRFTSRTCLRHS